jgi:hypothetical protein
MNRPVKTLAAIALTVAGVFAAHVGAQSGGGPYRIERSVIAGGGIAVSGGAFELRGTVGQSATAISAASSYRFYAGFWAPAAGPSSDFIFVDGFDP